MMFKKLRIALAIACAFVLFVGGFTPTSAATAKISKKKATMEVDSTLTLKMSGTKDTVKWTSSAKSVAKVSAKGKVTAISEGTATITATVGGSKYKCDVTVVDSNRELSDAQAKIQDGVPVLKDNDAFKVIGQYKYTNYGTTYFVYLVEALKSTECELKLTVSKPSGDIATTAEDTITLTEGKQNYFRLYIDSKYDKDDYKFSLKAKDLDYCYSSYENSVEVIKYNKNDDYLYVTVKQVKENINPYVQLKVLCFYNNKLVDSDYCYVDSYDSDFEGKNSQCVLSLWLYDVDYTDVYFYFDE